jgi:hypothetical protein
MQRLVALLSALAASQEVYPPSFEQCLSSSSFQPANSTNDEVLVLMTVSGDVKSSDLVEFAKDSQQVACWARHHGYRFETNVIVSQDYDDLHFFSARWQSVLDGELANLCPLLY